MQIDQDARPRLPDRAVDDERLGKLGDELTTLQAEVLAVQRNAANNDRLAMAGADVVQPPVIGNRERDAGRRRRCE